MKLQQRINEQFTQEKLAVTMAQYQLYYQIAMGVFFNDTALNEKEVSAKVKDSSLDIEPLHVLNTMRTLLQNFSEEEDFEAIFEDNIQINALLHALRDFIDQEDAMVNKEQCYDNYEKRILNDEFYTVKLHLHFENEWEERLGYWQNVITPDAALELKTSAYKLLMK